MLKRAVYRSILAMVRGAGHDRFRHNALLNRLLWDTAPHDALMLAGGERETFVVAAGDQFIGRSVFLSRQPFDFAKLERVAGLLADRHLALLIDIGANVGTICIPAVRRGLFARAIAIEPEPLNYALLRANVELNRLSASIETHNLALGERDDETLSFELSKVNFGDHRAIVGNGRHDGTGTHEDEANGNANGDGHGVDRETITVPSQTLDRVVGDIAPGSALLWMDTQGFEGHVLAGASRLLAHRPPLVVEFWPAALGRCDGLARLKQALVSAGYTSFFDLGESVDRARPFEAAAIDALHARLGGGDAQTDLLLV